VIVRAPHVDDDGLLDVYYTARTGEVPNPRTAEHLADCHDCQARYADCARLLDVARAEGDAEADEIFNADRLRAQQLAIARRLEHVGRAARVIRFPAQFVARRMNVTGRTGLTRWVYGAAAAGLVIGVGLTALYDSEFHRLQRNRQLAATARPTTTAPAAAVATAGTGATMEAADEAFLSDLEVALERPQTPELRELDALTPHVREGLATNR